MLVPREREVKVLTENSTKVNGNFFCSGSLEPLFAN